MSTRRFTDDEVRAIRNVAANRKELLKLRKHTTNDALGDKFGVSSTIISRINNNIHGSRLLTDDQINEIRELAKLRKELDVRIAAHTYKRIADNFNVSESTICDIINYACYRDVL